MAFARQKVNVAVRMRPLIAREVHKQEKQHWSVNPGLIFRVDPDSLLPIKPSQEFVFDHVYGLETTTGIIYDEIVKPIVNESFNGYHGTIFCYGQTSSGKTHTLYGTETDPGIINFLAQDIQNRLENVAKQKILIKVNLVEIYNNKPMDLLCPTNKIKLEERNGTVIPVDAKHRDILSGKDLIDAAKLLQKGRQNAATQMNYESSRSHAVLRLTINTIEEDVVGSSVEAKENVQNKGADLGSNFSAPGKRIISAVLNFVDLAGSEKVSQTEAIGQRLVEAGHINKSLSLLSQLVSERSKPPTTVNKPESANDLGVPSTSEFSGLYRSSKLMRLLQSSLSGDALIAIVANVTSASSEETLSTLKFAASAKKMTTMPKRNLISDSLHKPQYESTIKELQEQLSGKNEELEALRLALSGRNSKTKEDLQDAPVNSKRPGTNSTPKSTLRMRNALLNAANEEDFKNWKEEKQLMSEEVDVVKSENLLLIKELERIKELNEESNKLHKKKLEELHAQNADNVSQQEFEVGALKSYVTTLEKRLSGIQKLKESVQDQLKEMETKLKTEMQENIDLKIKLESCESQLKLLHSELADNPDANLKRKLMDEVEALKVTSNALADTLASAQKVKAVELKLQLVEYDVVSKSAQISVLSQEVDTQNSELAFLRNKIAKSNKIRGENLRETATQTAKMQDVSLENMVPRQDFDKLKSEADGLRVENEKLRVQKSTPTGILSIQSKVANRLKPKTVSKGNEEKDQTGDANELVLQSPPEQLPRNVQETSSTIQSKKTASKTSKTCNRKKVFPGAMPQQEVTPLVNAPRENAEVLDVEEDKDTQPRALDPSEAEQGSSYSGRGGYCKFKNDHRGLPTKEVMKKWKALKNDGE